MGPLENKLKLQYIEVQITIDPLEVEITCKTSRASMSIQVTLVLCNFKDLQYVSSLIDLESTRKCTDLQYVTILIDRGSIGSNSGT
eukprot:jgi/Botrbrau1/7006/Bobra.0165s0035.1